MKAMVAKKCRFSSILELQEVKMPEIKDDEVLIKVCSAGVNRVDIIDEATSYEGVCPGLECSGIIEAVGRNAICWKVGERVCAILKGGGYAEQVVVPANCLLPLPDDIDLDDAACLPYATCSIWSALFKTHVGQNIKDKRILIREGASWIGALAIRYAKYMGLEVIASTGSSELFSICDQCGADLCVDDSLPNFVNTVARRHGVDFVLDDGGFDLQGNIKCCRTGGKVVILDLHGTIRTRIDVALLQQKHAEIKVFDLSSRSWDYLASVIAEVRTHMWPLILQQKLVPIAKHRFPLIKAQKALNFLQNHDGIEKITIFMDFEEACRHLKMN